MSLFGMTTREALLSIALLVVIAAVAQAVTLKTDADSVSVYYGHTAKVYAWAVSDAPETRYIAFSAQLQAQYPYGFDLTASVDDSHVVADAFGAKGTYLYITPSLNLRGSEYVTITAQSCNADASVCETASKQLLVITYPVGSSYYLNSSAPGPYYIPAQQTGDGAPLTSTVTFAEYFYPTDYEADFMGGFDCKELAPGDIARLKTSLFNKGVDGSFDLHLIGDKAALSAVMSQELVSLPHNGLQDVFVDVAPSHNAGAGRYWVTVQALHNNVVLAEKDLCVDVVDKFQARLVLPQAIRTGNCGTTQLNAEIINEGTSADSYTIGASGFAEAIPGEVAADAGKAAEFKIVIDGTKLESGVVQQLEVTATSVGGVDVQPVKAKTSIEVVACQPTPQAGAVNVSQQETADLVKVVVMVENPSNDALKDVSIDVSGLPKGWEVTSESNVVIPAKTTTPITLFIRRTTDEEAKGVVITVKSGDQTIAVQELPTIAARNAGLTGFVTLALSQNLWFIALIILVALLVVVLAGRRKLERETKDSESEQKDAGKAAVKKRGGKEDLDEVKAGEGARIDE